MALMSQEGMIGFLTAVLTSQVGTGAQRDTTTRSTLAVRRVMLRALLPVQPKLCTLRHFFVSSHDLHNHNSHPVLGLI